MMHIFTVLTEKGEPMSEEAIYKLHRYPSGELEEFEQVQKLVRCKECRHWEMRNSPRGWCVVHQGYVSPQYFCADGERKESE